jgi:hypothetical protein
MGGSFLGSGESFHDEKVEGKLNFQIRIWRLTIMHYVIRSRPENNIRNMTSIHSGGEIQSCRLNELQKVLSER